MPTYPIQLKRNGTAAATPSSLLHGEVALNYADGKLFWKDASNVIQSFTFQAYALSSHAHAASAITSGTLDAARLPLATTGAAGAVIVGTGLGVSSGTVSVTYGTSAGTACQGNDSRLSDARTPTSHSHGNITNAGAIGSTANLPIITTTSGVLTTGTFSTTAGTFCEGNDSRLSDTRTPTDGSVTTAKIANDAVTYAKLQNVSATDRLLGRSSAGSGDVEEILCGSFGRSLIGSADAAAARSTLSVQPTASPAFTGAATFDNTGNVVPLTVTNTGTANSFVVNDAAGDTSPFVITSAGDVTIGTGRTVTGGSGGAFLASNGLNNDLVTTGRAAAITGTWGTLRVHQVSNYAGLRIIGDTSQTASYMDVENSSGTTLVSINSSGQLLVTAGSASAPGVAFSGDTNTGIAQLSAAGLDTLSLIAGGTERFRVNGNGETVSAATFVAPSGDTSIRGSGAGVGQWLGICGDAAGFGTGPAIIMRSAGAGGSTEFYSGSSQGVIINSSRQLLVTTGSASACGVAFSGDTNTGLAQIGGADTASVVTAGVERVRCTSGGTIEVRANSGSISHGLTYNENGGEIVLYDETQTAATLIDQISTDTRVLELVNGSNLKLGLGGSNTTGLVQFMRAGYQEAMRIDASGNVGIGAAPGTTLDIQRASADAAVFVQGQTLSTGAILQLYSGAGLGYVGTRNNYPLLITSNNAERMRVKTTGSVRFVPLSADPSTGNEAGDVYYNSSTNKLRVYNGTSWVDLH